MRASRSIPITLPGIHNDFYVDNLDIRENVTGRFIYRNVISPSLNPFGASTNSEGIYWINCNGSQARHRALAHPGHLADRESGGRFVHQQRAD